MTLISNNFQFKSVQTWPFISSMFNNLKHSIATRRPTIECYFCCSGRLRIDVEHYKSVLGYISVIHTCTVCIIIRHTLWDSLCSVPHIHVYIHISIQTFAYRLVTRARPTQTYDFRTLNMFTIPVHYRSNTPFCFCCLNTQTSFEEYTPPPEQRGSSEQWEYTEKRR